MAKNVVFEIDTDIGELTIQSGTLFLGEQTPIAFSGYTPASGNHLFLSLFDKDRRTPLADNATSSAILDLRYAILRTAFHECQNAHAFYATVIERTATGDWVGEVLAAGHVYVQWSPVAFDAVSGAPATLKGDKGDTGDQGPAGADGATGPAGPSNTLTIGTVTDGNAAAATITGSSPNQVLNLTLPRGQQGLPGLQGATGPAGADGSDGADGADGVSPTVAVTRNASSVLIEITDATGTHSASVYDGATGATGPQGPQGPQGVQGEKGNKGDTGATGPSGPQGVSGVYVGVDPCPAGYNVQIDTTGTCDYDPVEKSMDMTQPVGRDADGRLWTSSSSGGVIPYPSRTDFPATGEYGKIYLALDTNTSYTWDGTQYNSMDNVRRYATRSAFPAIGESGKLYLAMDTSIMYTWTGLDYTQLGQSVIVYTTRSAFPTNGSASTIYIANDTGITYIWNTAIATPAYVQVAGDVKKTDFASVTELPEDCTGNEMRTKLNTILNILKGVVTPVLFIFAPVLPLFSAEVLTNAWGNIKSTAPVVTNVTFAGLALTNDVPSIVSNTVTKSFVEDLDLCIDVVIDVGVGDTGSFDLETTSKIFDSNYPGKIVIRKTIDNGNYRYMRFNSFETNWYSHVMYFTDMKDGDGIDRLAVVRYNDDHTVSAWELIEAAFLETNGGTITGSLDINNNLKVSNNLNCYGKTFGSNAEFREAKIKDLTLTSDVVIGTTNSPIGNFNIRRSGNANGRIRIMAGTNDTTGASLNLCGHLWDDGKFELSSADGTAKHTLLGSGTNLTWRGKRVATEDDVGHVVIDLGSGAGGNLNETTTDYLFNRADLNNVVLKLFIIGRTATMSLSYSETFSNATSRILYFTAPNDTFNTFYVEVRKIGATSRWALYEPEFLNVEGGKMYGNVDIDTHHVTFGSSYPKWIGIMDNDDETLTFGDENSGKKSSIVPDDTLVATIGSISNAFPIVTNSYMRSQIDEALALKQDELPTPKHGMYLHANEETAEMEWMTVPEDGDIFVTLPSGINGTLTEDQVAIFSNPTNAPRIRIVHQMVGVTKEFYVPAMIAPTAFIFASSIYSDNPYEIIVQLSGSTGTWQKLEGGTFVKKNSIVNRLDSTTTDAPLSAAKGKELNDIKVGKTTTVNGHTLSNDVTITASDVGLGNVDNTSDANKPVSTATQTALNAKVNKTTTVNGHELSSNVTVSKSDVGLGNVSNTGDSATPVSGGTTKFTTGGAYTELNKKVNKSGDTMTGPLVFNKSGNESLIAKAGASNVRIAICGGTEWFGGGVIAVAGTNETFNPGGFDFRATKVGGNMKQYSFKGKGTGELYWGENKVVQAKKQPWGKTLSAHITCGMGMIYVGDTFYFWVIPTSTGAVNFTKIGGGSWRVSATYTRDDTSSSKPGDLPGTITFTSQESSDTVMKVYCD